MSIATTTKDVTDEVLADLIASNLYIISTRNTINNVKRDPSSLSFLIKRQMSQSECIRLGIAIEQLYIDIIMQLTVYSQLQNIKPTIKSKGINGKGNKDVDHLFRDDTTKTIYYAELKGNINLDTEKSIATINKCKAIVAELHVNYPEYTIKWCLLAYRFLTLTDIPATIRKKYAALADDNIMGINEYMKMLGVNNIPFSEMRYRSFLNTIANTMFGNNNNNNNNKQL